MEYFICVVIADVYVSAQDDLDVSRVQKNVRTSHAMTEYKRVQ